jgi:bacteriocin biosynthesis cyclodehydratase domain-containing protein
MNGGKEVTADDDRDHRSGGPRVGLRARQLAAGRTRYRLLPSIETFPASTGDLHLLRPGEAGDLVVRDAGADDRAVIAALQGEGAEFDELERVAGVTGDALETKLEALREAGVLIAEDGPRVRLPPALRRRFDRQLPYFAEWADAGTAQMRLRDATVLVLGCGGLGTWALAALATTGVGSFVLVDHDRVELSNLNRQVLFGADDVGRLKVVRAAAWVRRFDPDIRVRSVRQRVESAADVLALLDGVDVVVQTADWPPYRLLGWVADACQRAGVPYVVGGQRPPVLKLGPTFVPGRSACFRCQEAALERAYPLYRELSRARDARPARATTLGPASGIVGTLIGAEVMHLLLGRPVATEGRALILDLRTLESRWEAVEPVRGCPGCNHPGGDG